MRHTANSQQAAPAKISNGPFSDAVVIASNHTDDLVNLVQRLGNRLGQLRGCSDNAGKVALPGAPNAPDGLIWNLRATLDFQGEQIGMLRQYVEELESL